MKTPPSGWLNGAIGVLVFSGSLPATRLAVTGFDPTFLTTARATIAGVIAVALLLIFRVRRPNARDVLPLLWVALGVVVGFPLLTALALTHITAARSVVFIGLLPLATAIFAVVRGGEKPRPAFWCFALLGSACVASFAFLKHDGPSSLIGDLCMLAAVIVCGFGYAEGARLSRHLGGWQVISWTLVICLPFMAIASALMAPATWAQIPWQAWIGLAYVSLFSMLIGFFFWYRGLAQGGIAAVGQLQLLQPFMGLALAALLLSEPIAWSMVVATSAVVLCVAGTRRFAR